MKNLYFLFALLFLFTTTGNAQTTREEVYATPEKSGGVYYAYPSNEIGKQTPAPKGYQPFYISHLGRHGSRYLISDDDYRRVIDAMEEASQANALTPLGKDVLNRLQQVWIEVEGHGGDLSPLGVREQRGIAERMYRNFPEVFAGNAPVSARSTMVVRCVLSMDAFCERLKEFNPSLQTNREASEKYVRYLNHHTRQAIAYRSARYTWREQYRKFEDAHVKPERLINSLFSDPAFVNRRINPKEFMMDMFYIANGMQNIETNVSFYDIFEKEELFDIFQCKNFKVYAEDSNCAWNGGIMMENAKPLVRNILESANEAIANGNNGATLRFAHDGNIVPLAMLMHLKDCYNSVSDPAEFYKAFSTFKVAPMAGNIQMVFFRKKGSDEILVKFLQNENETSIPVETDMFPYYNWKDVEAFYTKLLNTNFNPD
ncbi:MAG: histidine-type phosphatase [Tannerellaceae bacterium]|nr:histidine-type phosphatase [Tannerellaceae bacterium]